MTTWSCRSAAIQIPSSRALGSAPAPRTVRTASATSGWSAAGASRSLSARSGLGLPAGRGAARRSPSIVVAQVVHQPGEAVDGQQVGPRVPPQEARRHPEVFARGSVRMSCSVAIPKGAGPEARRGRRGRRDYGRGSMASRSREGAKRLTAWSPDVRALTAHASRTLDDRGSASSARVRSGGVNCPLGRPLILVASPDPPPRPARWQTPTR